MLESLLPAQATTHNPVLAGASPTGASPTGAGPCPGTPRRRLPRPVLGLLLGPVLGLLLSTSPLAARDDAATVQARQRWNEGVSAFAKGEFELARAAFAQAYALKPTPPVLRNLGEAEIASGNYVAGANHLTRFLRQADDLPPEEAEKVRRSIAKAHPFVGHLTLTSDVSGAQVFVDDESAGTTPLQDTIYLEPGWREVRIAKGEREVQRLVEATAGQPYELHLSLNRQDATADAPSADANSSSPLVPTVERDRGSSWKTPVVITGGALAAVSLGVGGYFFLQANSLDRDATTLRNEVSGPGTSSSCRDNHADERCTSLRETIADGRRAERFAAGGLIAGGAFAVGTVLTWWLWPSANRTEVAKPSLQLAPLSDSAGLTTWGGALTGTF